MELRRVYEGDIVRCKLRGATFFAEVRGRTEDGLQISVLDRHKLPRGLPVTRVTARQVCGVWRQRTPGAPRHRPAAREAVPA